MEKLGKTPTEYRRETTPGERRWLRAAHRDRLKQEQEAYDDVQ